VIRIGGGLSRRGALAHPCTVTGVTFAASIAFIAYFVLALLIGGWGQRKGYSLGLGFLVSLVLTFIVGAVTVYLLRDKQTGRRGVVTWST
jgi:hypothetical protein